jgi:protein involved in polysaccharide export with SLBB domain
MSEQLDLTIIYESGEDGWIIASIPEVDGVSSQGRTREEARTNVIDALRRSWFANRSWLGLPEAEGLSTYPGIATVHRD